MPRSTKAIKITDQKKAWNKKSNPSNYKYESILQNKTILIVCEGQTEKLYFESFQVLGLNVKIFDLKGQSKLKLVESTKEIIDNTSLVFDKVWVVFDMDVKRGEQEFSDFDNAVTKANALSFCVAYSNDAFELWYYLHFNFSMERNLRSFYYAELSNYFSINYIKDGKKFTFSSQIYSILEELHNASQSKAIERARKLYDLQKDLKYHQQNPVTKVFELVEELNSNLRR